MVLHSGDFDVDVGAVEKRAGNVVAIALDTRVGIYRRIRYCADMSLVTLEVEIDHGRVIARGSEPLPEKGKGLLTLLSDSPGISFRGSVSDFIGKWAGTFSLPESPADDPRFAVLLAKHTN